MSLSSDNKKFHGFRSESSRKPPTDSKRFRSSEPGRGWDGSGGVELVPWSERRSKILDYVARVLPDEHQGMAASACLTLKMSGTKPTPEAILERLRAQGRSAEQMRAKGWMK